MPDSRVDPGPSRAFAVSTSTPKMTPESIAFGAALFSSSINAWLPPSFGGPKLTDADRDKEFNTVLRNAGLEARDSNLGLGHPEIGKPKQPR
jgi:hypothetical protein